MGSKNINQILQENSNSIHRQEAMGLSEQQKRKRSQINLQKLVLYVSVTDNDLPAIDREESSTVATELRIYFNDEQLLISHEGFYGENYLATQQFQNTIAGVLQQFRYEVGYTGFQWGLLELLQNWMAVQQTALVEYALFDEAYRNGVQNYLQNINRTLSQTIILSTSSTMSQQKEKLSHPTNKKVGVFSAINENRHKYNCDRVSNSSASKTSIHRSFPTERPSQQPPDPFNYYMHKFYDHYSKKSANILKTHEFEKLQHFYTTLNLTKFMTYCKQVGLLKAHKSVTVKYIQQLFVRNQDQRHVVEYEGFSKMVRELLTKVFGHEQKGYTLVGICNRENFVDKMRAIGVRVPVKKIVFEKPKKAKDLTFDFVDIHRQKEQIESKRLLCEQYKKTKAQTQQKNGGYEYAYQSAWLKIQPPAVAHASLLPLLPHKQSSGKFIHNLQHLLELDQEQDPYLKRFKRSAGQSQYLAEESGVIARMERRMENVVRRVR